MEPIKIKPCQRLRGTVVLPGDKSISHRAAILSAIAEGRTQIKNFLFSDDCLVTLNVLRRLGVKISINKNKKEVVIESSGVFLDPKKPLFMGESGTSARVLLGLFSSLPFKSKMTASPSLLNRPMARVITPLRSMGAEIVAIKKGKDEFLPLQIFPSPLRAIQWMQKIASAQVKSAILLAGLYAKGKTTVTERISSRDHTERMLKLFGADIKIRGCKISVQHGGLMTPEAIFIPGDISSAVFFIVAALLIKGSNILIKNAGINPTRMGAINVLKRMGGNIKILNKKNSFEPFADIEVTFSHLRATLIKQREIPSLIDELPILMVAAAMAKGETIIEGAQELKVKETDRIASMRQNLTKMGVAIRVKSLKEKVSIGITGVPALKSASLDSFCDHRTAMSMYVAASAAEGVSRLDDVSCMNKSFPQFLATIRQLSAM